MLILQTFNFFLRNCVNENFGWTQGWTDNVHYVYTVLVFISSVVLQNYRTKRFLTTSKWILLQQWLRIQQSLSSSQNSQMQTHHPHAVCLYYLLFSCRTLSRHGENQATRSYQIKHTASRQEAGIKTKVQQQRKPCKLD